MAPYNTPGVYTDEIARHASAVTPVATAIPAFIGFTQTAVGVNGESLNLIPTRISSLLEYEQYFGKAPETEFEVTVTQRRLTSTGKILTTDVAFSRTPPRIPDYLLYYSMQMFFHNGGGPCYIVSIGNTTSTAYSAELFSAAINSLEDYNEPTLLVFPDACSHRIDNVASDTNVGEIVDAALQSCARRRDRFVIADIRNAVVGGTDTNAKVTAAFRQQTLSDSNVTQFGAAYFPYLETGLNFLTSDAHIKITSHRVIYAGRNNKKLSTAGTIAAGTAINAPSVAQAQIDIYKAVTSFIRNNTKVTLPPSGAIAGIFASVDSARGVWKAPANVNIAMTIKPAINISDALNNTLNVDAASGKSINAIRAFAGKGVLLWGARTLAGNDTEWRYVPVRRFCNFVETSVRNTTSAFVFETNDANTWAKVRARIENFLLQQWRAGALVGAKPEQAFFVKIGLNQTMSANDILNNIMIVEIGIAAMRPTEFTVLRLSQQMAVS